MAIGSTLGASNVYFLLVLNVKRLRFCLFHWHVGRQRLVANALYALQDTANHLLLVLIPVDAPHAHHLPLQRVEHVGLHYLAVSSGLCLVVVLAVTKYAKHVVLLVIGVNHRYINLEIAPADIRLHLITMLLEFLGHKIH